MNLDTPKKKKYKVRIVAIQAGDPTVKFKFISEENIEGLTISMTLRLSGTDDTRMVLNSYVIGDCIAANEVTIMHVFTSDVVPENNVVECTFSLVSNDGALFDLIAPEEYSIHPQHNAANLFTCTIPYLSLGERRFTLGAGTKIILQSRDETGNIVFLNATDDGELILRPVFNSIYNRGSIWLLEPGNGTTSPPFSLQSQNDNSTRYYLKGDPLGGTLSLEANYDGSLGAQWSFILPYNHVNEHNVQCADTSGERRYLHKSVSDDNYTIQLSNPELVTDDKSITWYFHHYNDVMY